ncbi:MAG: DNA topoisomerase I [Thermoplasmatales archaeon]
MVNLVVAEKSNVAMRIAYSLSADKVERVKVGPIIVFRFRRDNEDYSVLSLRGHIVELDFPSKYADWKMEKLNEMIYADPEEHIKIKGIEDTFGKLTKDAREIIIATDYDREGELIGVETLRLMNWNGTARRARFSALTKPDLVNSFNNLAEIDYNLARSAEAREIIDLLWGAVLTRFFSIATGRLGSSFVSVGRVQSPTLTMLVERELEIREFVPESYYELSVRINGVKFSYDGNPIKDKEEAGKILEKIKNSQRAVVTGKDEKERKIYRPTPFSTTEFLREANKLGIYVEKAMEIAESLYQHGVISYPRTDNTVYPRTLSMKNVLGQLEDSYLKPEISQLKKESSLIPSRGRIETTDHPPIYPTAAIKKTEMKGDYFRIYDLIARRFISTIAENADVIDTIYKVNIAGFDFSYTASKTTNPGWMRYYNLVYYQEKEDPLLTIGEEKEFLDPTMDEKKTLPPPRYTQGSLIEKMDKEMLGTKSTRHEIIQKLYDRGFIEGNPVRVKPLGMAMGESLLLNSIAIAKPNMTAQLEKEMDLIANGKRKEKDVVDDSRKLLLTLLHELNKNSEKIKAKFYDTLNKEKVVGKCPNCGSDLIIDSTRNARFIKCIGPSADFFQFVPKVGKIEVTDQKCPVCGLFLIKVIRKNEPPEIRCVNNNCSYNTSREILGKCPQDGGNLVIRRSRKGQKFIGCSNYPKCTVTLPVPFKAQLEPTGKYCSEDNFPIAIFTYGKKQIEQCINPKCKTRSKTSKKGQTDGE